MSDEFGVNGLNNTSLVIHNSFELETIPSVITGFSPFVSIPYNNTELVHHYLRNVVDIQASHEYPSSAELTYR